MSNDEFSAFVETSDEWIRSHTGIGNRHVAEPSVATSDLALEACRKVLAKAGVAAEQVDLVLVATATGDFIGFPSVACIVQDGLGAKNAAAMDLVAGCTGFIYALETARNFVMGGGARNVLVAGADILTRVMNWKDRNTCVLFGDGAGAVLVQADAADGDRGILTSMLRSDGSGARLLERTEGGTRFPFTDGVVDPARTFLKMDGRQVYNFATRVVSEGIAEMMEKNKLNADDIAWIVPHQANVRIIEAAAKRIKLPMSKFFVNIEEYANTSAASIPIALSEMTAKNLLKKGDLILTFGFGAGLTYGGNLIRW
ncbi:MAG TPA: beta-ketoacyl-ACP synthase III [Spirochaetia bacterium]|nr:beta-ketoacyl-ACP synthase III [Spirochaetia bacterium]